MKIKYIFKKLIKNLIDIYSANFGQHKKESKSPRLWIMMYHRILPKEDPRYENEEPGMIVEPDTLKMHLQVLKKEFTMVKLSDWIERKNNNQTLPKKACAITFDDGWIDNHEYAFPILEKENIPATLFIVSDMVTNGQEFWPNRISRILKQPKELLQEIEWLAPYLSDKKIDRETLATIISNLKKHSDQQVLELILNAEKELNLKRNLSPTLMNWEQIKQCSQKGLIEIGSHTANHIRLKQELPPSLYSQEIMLSKQKIEKELNKTVKLFCYPNGDYCNDAIKEVSKYYIAAVTTEKGINSSNELKRFTLARIPVHQDISDTPRRLLARISNWR